MEKKIKVNTKILNQLKKFKINEDESYNSIICRIVVLYTSRLEDEKRQHRKLEWSDVELDFI